MKIKQVGFSLIEIAIVLFILGLIIAGTLTPLAVSIEQAQRNTVEEQFEDIQSALLGFTLTNGRLPCPDCRLGDADPDCVANGNVINDGLEDRDAAGLCALDVTPANIDGQAIEGNLPWVTLGIKGTDEWGNTFNYAVDEDFADDRSLADPNDCAVTDNVSFALCFPRAIDVIDRAVACAGGAGGNVALGIPAIVYSQGSNLASSCNELENTNGDNIFVASEYSQTADVFYDDLIIWISPFILNAQMVKAGLLP